MVIMLHYKITKARVYSANGDIIFFKIDTEVSQVDAFAPYLFIIYLDNVLQTSIDSEIISH